MTILGTSEYGLLIFFAWVAQLVEQLICNQRVGSSSLSAGAIIAALLNTGLNSAGVGQPLPQRKKEDGFPVIRF